MNEITCVPVWLLLTIFLVGFVYGYFGDIFIRIVEKENKIK